MTTEHVKRPRATGTEESGERVTKVADTGDLEQCFGDLDLCPGDESMGRRPEPGQTKGDFEACRVAPYGRGKSKDPKTRWFKKLKDGFKSWPKPIVAIVHDYLQNTFFDQRLMGSMGTEHFWQGFRYRGLTECLCPVGPRLVVSQASISSRGCAEWIFRVSGNKVWSCGVVPESQLMSTDTLQSYGIGVRTLEFKTASLPACDMTNKLVRMWLDEDTVRIFADGKEEFFAQVPHTLFPVRFGIMCFFGARVILLEEE